VLDQVEQNLEGFVGEADGRSFATEQALVGFEEKIPEDVLSLK
jgi:hypothetical protein